MSVIISDYNSLSVQLRRVKVSNITLRFNNFIQQKYVI